MIPVIFKKNHIVINTGNILNVNKKAGQKPTDELVDCIRATLSEPEFKEDNEEVHRSFDDALEKIKEHERENIKIGAKLFLNTNSVDYLNESINKLLKVLNVKCLDNLVLAYHPLREQNEIKNAFNNDKKEKNNEEKKLNIKLIEELKLLWKALEKFVEDKMICQLGVADLDIDSLKELCKECKIPPTIVQINLLACCVVPPPLQEFCNSHEIQLLTHSDPEVILTSENLNVLGIEKYEPKWIIRYQVHVKCRGLLTAKGFIIGAFGNN